MNKLFDDFSKVTSNFSEPNSVIEVKLDGCVVLMPAKFTSDEDANVQKNKMRRLLGLDVAEPMETA